MSARLTVTPREAAALDRLLDAYLGNDDADPGMDDLRSLRAKVRRLDQDHTAYEVPPARDAPRGRLGGATRVRNSATGTIRLRRPGTDLWDAPDFPDADPVTTDVLESLAEMHAEDRAGGAR